MPFHYRLALLRRGVEAHLRALQRAVLEGKRRHHDGPALVLAQLGALEVIGEEPFFFFAIRFILLLFESDNGRPLRRIAGGGMAVDQLHSGCQQPISDDEPSSVRILHTDPVSRSLAGAGTREVKRLSNFCTLTLFPAPLQPPRMQRVGVMWFLSSGEPSVARCDHAKWQ